MKAFSLLCLALVLITAIPFALYVWPTKYAYDHIKLGTTDFPVRIHRFSGEAEQLSPVGWQPLRPILTAPLDVLLRPADFYGCPTCTQIPR